MLGRPVCRDTQLSLLSLYLGLQSEDSRLAECLLVQGVQGTGKTLTLKYFLSQHKQTIASAFVDCIEAYQPKLLYQCILEQLGLRGVKSDNVSDFTRLLGDTVGEGKAVIVLENADRLREDVSLFSVLTRLQEVTKCNIACILETRLDWSKLRPSEDILTPIRIHFNQYSRDELSRLVAAFLDTDPALRTEKENMFRLQYSGLVLSVFYSVTRSLTELIHIARLNYQLYQQPVLSGACSESDSKKLWANIEPHLKKCLSTVHLREVASQQMLALDQEKSSNEEFSNSIQSLSSIGPTISNVNRITIELPFYSKFLLIAAFLASYNPAKSDKRFFVKHHGKQRKTASSIRTKEKLNSQLTGPKPFPLERLLAIFYNIVEEQVNPTANIYSQVTSLVRLQLLTAIGVELMDQPKYKCNVSMDFVRTVAKTVQFDVYKYLYDH
jgi:origin recognition complex subunit 5